MKLGADVQEGRPEAPLYRRHSPLTPVGPMRMFCASFVVTLFVLESPIAQAAAPSRSTAPARPARALEDRDAAEDADPAPLADAVAAYRAKKPQAASLALHQMLEEGAWPDKEAKIQYFLALSLYDLGMVHAAEHYLVAVLKHGPSDPWFALALPRLAALATQTGDDASLARIAARVAPEDVPASARDTLAYLRGARLYDAGDLTAARAELADVAESSAYYPRARYLTGVILNKQDRLKSAASAFREVAASDDAAALSQDRVRDLSVLNLGRIYYGIGEYAAADQWYAAVPRGSTYWPESVFESAWSNFLLDDPDRTLGQLLTLQAPSVAADEFLPEASILAALTWFTVCDFEQVDRAVDNFDARYRPMHAEMKAFVQAYASDEGRQLADQAYDRYFGPDPADTALPKALFGRVLRDRELAGVVGQLASMDAEEALVHAQKPAWRDTVGAELLDVLAKDRVRLKRRGGLALLREMSTTTTWLGDLIDQAQIIRFERVNAWSNVLDAAAGAPAYPDATVAARTDASYSVSSDRIYWPFNGEFWDDELGSYRYATSSSCK
jgi:TolA-binding protein